MKKKESKVTKDLKRALRLLETKGWCKGNFAIDENGGFIHPRSEKAVAFCAVGAIARITNANPTKTMRTSPHVKYLRECIPAKILNVSQFNDTRCRFISIRRWFERAIKLSKAKSV